MSQALPKDVPQTLRRWKRYPASKHSEVEWLGEIPEHWQAYKLKRVSEISYGLTLELDRTETEGTFIISLPNVTKKGQLVLEEVPKTQLTDEDKKSLLLRKGDLLFNWRNGSSDHVGKTAYFDADGEYTHVSFLLRLRFDLAKHDSRYYHMFINNLRNTDFFASAKTRVNNTYNQAELRQLEVIVPPRDEQQAIASFLDRETAKIDALIAKKERLIELLQEKCTAIISHAVTKGLDPTVPLEDSGVEWLEEIPAHWKVMALKRSLKSSDYGLSDNIKGEGIFKVLTMGHIQDGKVLIPEEGSLDNVPKELVLEYDDLLFNRTNSRELVGKVGIFKGNSEDKVTFASYLVRLRSNDYAEPNYLNFLLNSKLILSKVRQDALLSINQANLNPTKYCQIRIPLPPIDEQAAIASYLDRETAKIDALITKIREGIEKLKEYRTALISAAVTGKIDVRNEVTS